MTKDPMEVLEKVVEKRDEVLKRLSDETDKERLEESRDLVSGVLHEAFELYLKKEAEYEDSWRDVPIDYLTDQKDGHLDKPVWSPDEFQDKCLDIILFYVFLKERVRLRAEESGLQSWNR